MLHIQFYYSAIIKQPWPAEALLLWKQEPCFERYLLIRVALAPIAKCVMQGRGWWNAVIAGIYAHNSFASSNYKTPSKISTRRMYKIVGVSLTANTVVYTGSQHKDYIHNWATKWTLATPPVASPDLQWPWIRTLHSRLAETHKKICEEAQSNFLLTW